MSKRKKRSGRRRSRTKRNKNKRRHKKKSTVKEEKQKPESRKKKRALNDKNRRLKEKFKTRQRKQDIIFIIFIVIFAVSIFGGYYLYEKNWDSGDGGAASGPIEPMNGNNGAMGNGDPQVDSNKIEWHIYDEGMKLSKSTNKPVMIDFYYDECQWCIELDKNTYSDSRVIEKAKSFVSIKVDRYETNTYNGEKLASENNVQGYPTIVFLDTQGNEINRVGGYEDANKFLVDMDDALTKS